MSETWSEQLVKKGISEFLIEELDEHLFDENKIVATKKLLSRTVLTENDLKELQEAIESLADDLPEDYIDYLLEECDEMEDDIEWASSDKGKEILAINDWIQKFYDEFRAKPEFNEVLIGSHTEKSVVVVTGEVKLEIELYNLKEYVSSKEPPLEVLYQVNVSA